MADTDRPLWEIAKDLIATGSKVSVKVNEVIKDNGWIPNEVGSLRAEIDIYMSVITKEKLYYDMLDARKAPIIAQTLTRSEQTFSLIQAALDRLDSESRATLWNQAYRQKLNWLISSIQTDREEFAVTFGVTERSVQHPNHERSDVQGTMEASR
jgi:hypothetical protein